jgi:hypothetical protein
LPESESIADIELRTLCTSIWVPALLASPPSRFGSVPEVLTTRQNCTGHQKIWRLADGRLLVLDSNPAQIFREQQQIADFTLRLLRHNSPVFFLQTRASKEFFRVHSWPSICLGHRTLNNLPGKQLVRDHKQMRCAYYSQPSGVSPQHQHIKNNRIFKQTN